MQVIDGNNKSYIRVFPNAFYDFVWVLGFIELILMFGIQFCCL